MNPEILMMVMNDVKKVHKKQVNMKKKYIIRDFEEQKYHAPDRVLYNHFSSDRKKAKRYDSKEEAERFIRVHISFDCVIEEIYAA